MNVSLTFEFLYGKNWRLELVTVCDDDNCEVSDAIPQQDGRGVPTVILPSFVPTTRMVEKLAWRAEKILNNAFEQHGNLFTEDQMKEIQAEVNKPISLDNLELKELLESQKQLGAFLLAAAIDQRFYIADKTYDGEIVPETYGFKLYGRECSVGINTIKMDTFRRGNEPFDRWARPTKKSMLEQIKSMCFYCLIKADDDNDEMDFSIDFADLPLGLKKVWKKKLLDMFMDFEGVEA